MTPLVGEQLPLLPEVPPYWLSNPPAFSTVPPTSPARDTQGQRVTFCQCGQEYQGIATGQASETHLWVSYTLKAKSYRGQVEAAIPRSCIVAVEGKPVNPLLAVWQLEQRVRQWVQLLDQAGDGYTALQAIQAKSAVGRSTFEGLCEGIQAPFRRNHLRQACHNVLDQLSRSRPFQPSSPEQVLGPGKAEAPSPDLIGRAVILVDRGAVTGDRLAGRQNRRHSEKGHASGWIEERQGNCKRKHPTTSYYYCYLEQGARRKLYVRVSKLHRVCQMVADRRPVKEIVEFLNGEKL